jgi:tryptophan-rich sensory protein
VDRRRLGFAVLPVAAAAGIGGLGARRAKTTYQLLGKPRWAPPAAVFAPVWSTLYVLIGAAGWRLSANASGRTRALHLTQMALNGAWPAVFFELRDKRASLAVIALLDISLALEVAMLRREDRLAASLLMPYLVWSGFATALNAAVTEPQLGD